MTKAVVGVGGAPRGWSGTGPWSPPRVKICCIESVEEALAAVAHGASAVGLVSEMPSGPGVIDRESIRRIATSVPPGVATFLLTSLKEAQAIAEEQKRSRANTVQLCDRLPPEAHRKLRRELPGIRIVQVVHVTGPESIHEAREASGSVDALLLDSGRPNAELKELGGTGRTHDWSISRRIRASVGVPVFLAGGLNPGNVAEAVRQVRPYGLDVCSGLRTEGRLDEVKLAKFMREAWAAGGAGREEGVGS